jgi:hypothetical protein
VAGLGRGRGQALQQGAIERQGALQVDVDGFQIACSSSVAGWIASLTGGSRMVLPTPKSSKPGLAPFGRAHFCHLEPGRTKNGRALQVKCANALCQIPHSAFAPCAN